MTFLFFLVYFEIDRKVRLGQLENEKASIGSFILKLSAYGTQASALIVIRQRIKFSVPLFATYYFFCLLLVTGIPYELCTYYKAYK